MQSILKPFPDAEPRPYDLGPLVGALIMAASGVIYFWTHHPLLAVILPWLHGGWKTFCTGIWILHEDPMRSRARICFLAYLAAACWKAAAMALATIGVCAVLDQQLGIQANDEVYTALAALVLNLVLNTFLSTVVVVLASIYKVRVDVRANLRSVVKGKLTNAPRIGPPPRHVANLGALVVTTAMIAPVVVAAVIAGAFAATVLNGVKPPNAPVNILEIVVVFAMMFGIPLLAIPFCVRVTSGVIAQSPGECWPPGTILPRRDEFGIL